MSIFDDVDYGPDEETQEDFDNLMGGDDDSDEARLNRAPWQAGVSEDLHEDYYDNDDYFDDFDDFDDFDEY